MPSLVRDNPALSRFELDAGGFTAVANYRLGNGVITFTHTETPEQARGRGIGSALVNGALNAARSRGLKVVPACSFVRSIIARHHQFQDLLA
jgi:predicted GNAT family acetyltransferase